MKKFVVLLLFMMSFSLTFSQDIGNVTFDNPWIVIEDDTGNKVYTASSPMSEEYFVGFSNKLIVFQNDNEVGMYTYIRGNLIQLYRGTGGIDGVIQRVSGMSIFTKSGSNWNCKYTVNERGSLINDYCRN